MAEDDYKVAPDTEQRLSDIQNAERKSLPQAISLVELGQKDLPEEIPIVEGLLDKGIKVMIVGKAKSGKTFFGLTLACHIAAGVSLGGLQISQSFRVLYVNYELRESKLYQRLSAIKAVLLFDDGVVPNADKNFFCMTLRGAGHEPEELVSWIIEETIRVKADIIFLDPLYLLLNGNENDSQVAREAAFDIDRIIQRTGACFVYLHHDTKGRPGDKDNVDRGSGSGLLGRHWDAQIAITPHAQSESAIVLGFESRDNAPLQDMVLERAANGCLLASTLTAIKQTRSTEHLNRFPLVLRPTNLDPLKRGPIPRR